MHLQLQKVMLHIAAFVKTWNHVQRYNVFYHPQSIPISLLMGHFRYR